MEKKMKPEDQKTIKRIINDPIGRVETCKASHLWFFHVYFNDYVRYEIAPFHREMFKISEDENIKLAVICSFRGSGKSTIMTTSYPIWAILGRMQRKFVVIISQTQEQAKQHFGNLKKELETNQLLKQDLGPFQQQDEWNSCSLVIPKYNAKIIAVSREQSFRGVKHGRYRPDLIIADDIEDLASTKNEESRKATYNWFTGEVLPLRAENTKTIVIGNLLHEDSLIMRLSKEIEENTRSGVFRKFPLLSEKKEIAWPGKYRNNKAIDAERKTIGDKFAWLREYLLIIADDQEPLVEAGWMQYYQVLPVIRRGEIYSYAAGVDIAVSEREKADYTAIVSCQIIGSGDEQVIYILPNPIESRMRLPNTVKNIRSLIDSWGKPSNYKIYIEEVGTQRGLTQWLEDEHIKAAGVEVGHSDKRTRLSIISNYIQSGRIRFPEKGIEKLKNQILNFGMTVNDDLVDAFTTLIQGIMRKPPSKWNGANFTSLRIKRSDTFRGGGIRSLDSGSCHSVDITDNGPIFR